MIAAPDRDLLISYQNLFEMQGHDTSAAFDGFQVMAWLQERKCDLILLDRELPLVEHARLMRLINDLNVPCMVFQKKRMRASFLLEENLADVYMVYPFLPEEVFDQMKKVFQKREEGRIWKIEDVMVNESAHLLDEKVRVTNEELQILQWLSEESTESRLSLPIRHGLYYVNALNLKFEKLGKKVRIRYKMKKGYEAVTKHE